MQTTASRDDRLQAPLRTPNWGHQQIDALAALDAVATTLSNPTSVSAAVLPVATARCKVGVPATAFVAIANAPGNAAVRCSVSPASNIASANSAFKPQIILHAVTGTANTPVDIAPGGFQTFVISFTPIAAFSSTDALFTFVFLNSAKSPTYIGVNTLLLSPSNVPVPDVIALAATVTNDGIVNIPGTNSAGPCEMATVNVGASGSITASAVQGAASLPVNILLSTDPASGQCISGIGPTVTTQINANATEEPLGYLFRVAAPYRLIRQRTGSSSAARRRGVTRRSTSVAVRTQ